MTSKLRYYVVDCPFNRQWHAKLIGRLLATAPSYCVVVAVDGRNNPQQIEAGLAQAEIDCRAMVRS